MGQTTSNQTATPTDGASEDETAKTDSVNFGKLRLTESWCSAECRERELEWNGKSLVCSEYCGCWSEESKRERYLKKRVKLSKMEYDKFCVDLFNWGVPSWYGQTYNSDMLDGEGFSLKVIENGKSHFVNGSNAYPPNYRQFYDAVKNIFDARSK